MTANPESMLAARDHRPPERCSIRAQAQMGVPRQGLSFVFTTPAVSAVRLPGRRPVLTRSDANLPFGYRAAVFEYLYQPAAGAGSFSLTPLGAGGEPIASDGSGMPVEPVRSWGPAARPLPGSCSLTSRVGAGLTFGVGSVVTSVTAAPAVVGAAFLPCIERNVRLDSSSVTSFPISRRVMQAFILLNAKNPATAATRLPGVRPLRGHPGVFDNPDLALPDALSDGLTAKRVGEAWVVVAGGRSSQERLATLDGLQVGAIVTRPSAAVAVPGPTQRCNIGYRPASGLVETAQQSGNQNGICSSASFYYLERWPLTADLVLSTGQCQRIVRFPADCARRDRRLLASRRVTPLAGHPDDYTVSALGIPSATIKRLQRSWLVVTGGANTQQQQLLLDRLSATIAPSLGASLTPAPTNIP